MEFSRLELSTAWMLVNSSCRFTYHVCSKSEIISSGNWYTGLQSAAGKVQNLVLTTSLWTASDLWPAVRDDKRRAHRTCLALVLLRSKERMWFCLIILDTLSSSNQTVKYLYILLRADVTRPVIFLPFLPAAGWIYQTSSSNWDE